MIDLAGLLPLTIDMLLGVAAALKAGRYRSGTAYLYLAKQLHIKQANSWTPDLELWLQDVARSVRRRLGPSKPANPFGLERMASISTKGLADIKGGPIAAVETASACPCGCGGALKQRASFQNKL